MSTAIQSAAMTEEQLSTSRCYVAAGGMSCPVCDSEHLSVGKALLVGVGTIWPNECNTCGSTWHEVHKLDQIVDVTDKRGIS